MRLERRACTIPMPVLRSTTPRKVRFFQGAGQDDERGQDDIDQVEQGAGILDDEFLDRLGLELGVDVDLALRDALGDLG